MSGSQSNAEMDALMALGELAHAASYVDYDDFVSLCCQCVTLCLVVAVEILELLT